jgi:hypothetical protein
LYIKPYWIQGVLDSYAGSTHGLEPTRKIGSVAHHGQHHHGAHPAHHLSLAAFGIRKKFFLDIYALGVYLSDAKVDDVTKTIKSAGDFGEFAKPAGENASLAFVLLFQRTVGAEKIVDALVSSLSGEGEEYNRALLSFKNVLLSNIGSDGLKKGEELIFVYRGAAGTKLDVYLGPNYMGSVESAELRSRLNEVYVGEKTVAPDVPVMLKKLFVN